MSTCAGNADLRSLRKFSFHLTPQRGCDKLPFNLHMCLQIATFTFDI